MVKLSFISPNYPTISHYPLLIIIGFSFIFQSISHLYPMISYEYTIIKYKSILSYFVLSYLILFYSVNCNIYIYISLSISLSIHRHTYPIDIVERPEPCLSTLDPWGPWALGDTAGRSNLSTSFRLHARGTRPQSTWEHIGPLDRSLDHQWECLIRNNHMLYIHLCKHIRMYVHVYVRKCSGMSCNVM